LWHLSHMWRGPITSCTRTKRAVSVNSTRRIIGYQSSDSFLPPGQTSLILITPRHRRQRDVVQTLTRRRVAKMSVRRASRQRDAGQSTKPRSDVKFNRQSRQSSTGQNIPATSCQTEQTSPRALLQGAVNCWIYWHETQSLVVYGLLWKFHSTL